MARCPFAKWVPCNVDGHYSITPTTLIYHSVAGSATSAVNYFTGGGTNLQSHFVVDTDGSIYQLVDTEVAAYANIQANGYAVSVETGNTAGKGVDSASFNADVWTPEQLDAMERIARWVNEVHGVPLVRATSAESGGLGVHNDFAPWSVLNGGGTDCPGEARKAQFANEFLPRLTGAPSTATKAGFGTMNDDQIKGEFAAVKAELEQRINQLESKDVLGQVFTKLDALTDKVTKLAASVDQMKPWVLTDLAEDQKQSKKAGV